MDWQGIEVESKGSKRDTGREKGGSAVAAGKVIWMFFPSAGIATVD